MKVKSDKKSVTGTSSRILTVGLWVAFAIYFCIFFARQVNFSAGDLGRHLTNGKLFLETFSPIATNFYSYTEPDFPCINHHWASGVVFYLVQQVVGFKGLSVFYIILQLLTAILFIRLAAKFADLRFVILIAVLLTPLFAYRTEIRPEGFSYLFAGVFLTLLQSFSTQRTSFLKTTILLCITQIAWVNAHIFFFLGPLMTGTFLLQRLLMGDQPERVKKYLLLLVLVMVSSLVNPFGFKGMLTPLTIFNEYGYMVAENQTIFFMQSRFSEFTFIHTEIVIILLLVLLARVGLKKQLLHSVTYGSLILFFSILAVMAVRGITLFALMTLPASAFLMQIVPLRITKRFTAFCSIAAIGIVAAGCMSAQDQYWSPHKWNTGLGLMKNNEGSARFFMQHGITGPILNNYDLGGYLIYYLHPREKVFVDNRPEAYSTDFFNHTYYPLQESETAWKKMDSLYHFNAIWFYRHDNTTHAQPFLIRRINDPTWAPVYVDDYILLLLRRNEQNAGVISTNELPQSMFNAVPGGN